jgi:hypothetical protein
MAVSRRGKSQMAIGVRIFGDCRRVFLDFATKLNLRRSFRIKDVEN